MDKLSFISDVISIIGACISSAIWYSLKKEKKFNTQRIKIQLKMPESVIDLPYEIERRYLTRSEVQGLLGILPIKEAPDRKANERYKLSFLNTPAFFEKLKAAQDNKDISCLEISCSPPEMEQFDLEKIRQQCRVTDLD
jgi:hypothetical protein